MTWPHENVTERFSSVVAGSLRQLTHYGLHTTKKIEPQKIVSVMGYEEHHPLLESVVHIHMEGVSMTS